MSSENITNKGFIYKIEEAETVVDVKFSKPQRKLTKSFCENVMLHFNELKNVMLVAAKLELSPYQVRNALRKVDKGVVLRAHSKTFKNEVGNTYGRLSVIEFAGTRKRSSDTFSAAREAMFICRCTCGNEKVIAGYQLRHGSTKSCGCLRSENMKKISERNQLNK